MRKEIDITENIASGNVDHIISILLQYRESGYDRLYWDGYDSSICLYKVEERQTFNCPFHSYSIDPLNKATTRRKNPPNLGDT